ncbi:MAG: capsular biosynthesis protein [Hellea sp.]|jgi:capsule biosynthesis phosphatase|nr:capsular biosynthesis protein [Hellea sp.]
MSTQETIVVDIDDTICYPRHNQKESEQKYAMALPNEPMIASLQKAKSKGFRIVLHTARRMLTHGGDINKIIEDVGQITVDWLKKYDVPYDEIVWGKPYGVYYIDDKAMTPEQFVKTMEWI